MRAFIAVLLFGALVAPSAASAQGPTLLSPPPGAVLFTGDDITFTARDAAASMLSARISMSPATDAEGILGNDMGSEIMSGGPPDFSTSWLRAQLDNAAAGTYYWQAYRIDCFTPSYPDCKIESEVRSFSLVVPPPAPGPTPLAPADGAKFLAGKRITFRAQDDSENADVRVLVGRSTRVNANGVFRNWLDESRMDGGPTFEYVWDNDLVWTGTLYWQAIRDECDVGASDDACRYGGAVRRLVITPSKAQISAPDRCYREGSKIPVRGSGFTPRRLVDLEVAGNRKVTRRTDAEGRLRAKVPVPNMPGYPDTQRNEIWAYERGNDANEPTEDVKMVSIAMAVNQASWVREGQKIPFRFSGFPNNRRMYGHYVLGGRVRGHQLLGTTKGPCGMLSTKAELIPSAIEHAGTWTAQYDARKRYSRGTSPSLRRKISVTLVPAAVR